MGFEKLLPTRMPLLVAALPLRQARRDNSSLLQHRSSAGHLAMTLDLSQFLELTHKRYLKSLVLQMLISLRYSMLVLSRAHLLESQSCDDWCGRQNRFVTAANIRYRQYRQTKK